jgi:hypothetical protein
MDVTVTLSQDTAWKLADLVRHELSTSRHQSVLHLRLDDHGDTRDELWALANTLDA